MSSNFNINDFVWAKVQGFSHWPALIVEPNSNTPEKPTKISNTKIYWVYFFGTHNYAWIEEKHIKDYRTNKDEFATSNKTKSFKRAISEIDLHIENSEKDPQYTVPKGKKEKVPRIQKTQKRKQVSTKSEKKKSRFSPEFDEIVYKKTTESDKQAFGVIGLGLIGTKLVNTLLKSGHKVNVWNRTVAKCHKVQIDLDDENESSIDCCTHFQSVILNSDITFVCVSDQNALKKIVQDTFGMNSTNSIFQDKGLVEMTTLNSETSKYIKDIIKNKGGRYLETQIQTSGIKDFTLEDLANGYLPKSLLLTAGDKDLFDDCEVYFNKIADKAVYLGDVGCAANLSLIMQMISAANLAGLAEGMALAETCGIDPKEFIIIIASAPLSCNFIKCKARNIAESNYNKVAQSLESMERDLKLGLELANDMQQPMSVISKVKEIFSHCCKLGYGQSDISAIYMRNRH